MGRICQMLTPCFLGAVRYHGGNRTRSVTLGMSPPVLFYVHGIVQALACDYLLEVKKLQLETWVSSSSYLWSCDPLW